MKLLPVRTIPQLGVLPRYTPFGGRCPSRVDAVEKVSRAREGHSAASGRPNGTSLCCDSGGLNAVSPCYDVAAQQFCQILGAPVLWHRRTRPEVLHSVA